MVIQRENKPIVNAQRPPDQTASLDMEKFKQGYGKLLQQAMQGTSQGAASGSSDIIKFDARLKMSMESPAPAQAEGEQKVSAPKQIKIDMVIDGDINIVDPGGPFNAPDVSAAKEMTMGTSPQN